MLSHHTHKHLGWQGLLYVLLDSAQEEGLQLLVQGGETAGVPLPIHPMLRLKLLPVGKPVGNMPSELRRDPPIVTPPHLT